jgi:hypothetical protein
MEANNLNEERNKNEVQKGNKHFKAIHPKKQIAFILALINFFFSALPVFPYLDLAIDEIEGPIIPIHLLITTACFCGIVLFSGFVVIFFSTIRKKKSYLIFGLIITAVGIVFTTIMIINEVIPYSYWYPLSLIFLLLLVLSLIGITYSILSLREKKDSYGLIGLIISSFTFLYQLFHLIYLNIIFSNLY